MFCLVNFLCCLFRRLSVSGFLIQGANYFSLLVMVKFPLLHSSIFLITSRGYTEPGGATRLPWWLHQLGNQAALVAPPAR